MFVLNNSSVKDISEKYIDPPHTTDFGIMFLPVESLYAEVLRHPGLFEILQRKYRITVTGPTTLSALLNSLQKTEVEQYFNALQKGGNPQPLLYIEINDPIGVVEQTPMIAEDCEERKAILTNQHIRLKFCTRGNKYEIVEQTIIYNK